MYFLSLSMPWISHLLPLFLFWTSILVLKPKKASKFCVKCNLVKSRICYLWHVQLWYVVVTFLKKKALYLHFYSHFVLLSSFAGAGQEIGRFLQCNRTRNTGNVILCTSLLLLCDPSNIPSRNTGATERTRKNLAVKLQFISSA